MLTFGWQMTALKDAQLNGLSVKPATLDRAKKWLKSCAAGGDKVGQFSFRPHDKPVLMLSTTVGVLASQYLGADKKDPAVLGGVQFLMANLPGKGNQDTDAWFFGTQVLHNMADENWKTWQAKLNNYLLANQSRTGCASGSWDPATRAQGRVMETSLCCLSLEVYYRYLKLYQLDKPEKPATSEPVRK